LHLNTECSQTDRRKKASQYISPVHSIHLADIIIILMVNIPELIVQKPGLHTELSCITQKDLNASDICVNVPKSVGDLWHFQ